MADSTFLIPTDIDAALKERADVWGEYDRAVGALKKIEELSGKLGGTDVSVEAAQTLTPAGLPPLEIHAALSAVEAELSAIQNAEAEIKGHEEEIAKHKQLRTILIVVAIAVILIVILLLTRG